MKKILALVAVPLFSVPFILSPEPAFAKKGGIGHGGGYSDDTLYHSHSERSYSGKDQFKGKGHAYGRSQDKSSQGKGHAYGRNKDKSNQGKGHAYGRNKDKSSQGRGQGKRK